MAKRINMIGEKFGRLLVIKEVSRDKYNNIRYLCKCDCGNETLVYDSSLKNNSTKSCGCYQKEMMSKRMTKYKNKILYKTWGGMKQRCNNKNHDHYKNYGGRGITICDEWKNDYNIFLKWALENGYEEGKQLDRINNDGSYCPENCRWVTPLENANNRSVNKYYTINGVCHTFAEWCRIYGIKYTTAGERMRKMGWDVEKALSTPLMHIGRNTKKKLSATR